MKRRMSALAGELLTAPLPAFLVLVYAVPFLGIALWSVTLPEPRLSQYSMLINDPLVASVFFHTFRISALVTLVLRPSPMPSPWYGSEEPFNYP